MLVMIAAVTDNQVILSLIVLSPSTPADNISATIRMHDKSNTLKIAFFITKD